MFKITDITSLGTDYTVSDPMGQELGIIQVIPYSAILSAALGPYTEDFGDYSSYIEKSLAVLSGFDQVDPLDVLWYATTEDQVELEEIFAYAIKNNYNRIILEHLEDLE